MGEDDLCLATARELARRIRERRASASEVVEAHLERIRRRNGALNAVVTLDEEGARRRAREADAALARGELWGPLHGVPVTVKDTYETAGLRTTSGYPRLSRHVPARDATTVARLRAAGAILLGKTNLALLATDLQSDNPVFGRARNPWDLERTPGGSSGGSGAAVAAGLSPLDLASDLGGSIRVPAHYCGVFGLKPTEHRVPARGHIPDWSIPGTPGRATRVRHMGTYGFLARDVEDLALALSIVEGPDGEEPWIAPPPAGQAPARELRECRFAWSDQLGGVPLSADTRAALAGLAAELARRGCRVERRDPEGFDVRRAWETWGELSGAELGPALPLSLRLLFRLLFLTSGRPPTDRGLVRGIGMSRSEYLEALGRRDALAAGMEAFLAGLDAWLVPVTAGPAFTHRRTGAAVEVDGHRLPYMVAAAALTTIFSVTGNPVVVLPLARSAEGLPIGVQVVGRRWGDRELLAVAGLLAGVTGPFRPPPEPRQGPTSG